MWKEGEGVISNTRVQPGGLRMRNGQIRFSALFFFCCRLCSKAAAVATAALIMRLCTTGCNSLGSFFYCIILLYNCRRFFGASTLSNRNFTSNLTPITSFKWVLCGSFVLISTQIEQKRVRFRSTIMWNRKYQSDRWLLP